MIQLCADLCDPLLALLSEGRVHLDGVEVGPWFSPAQIAAYRRSLPELPFFLHAADLIAGVGLLPGAQGGILKRLQASASPWISVHTTLWPPGALTLLLRYHIRLPRPSYNLAAWRFAWQVRRLQRAAGVPVLLENLDPLPFPGYEVEVRPERICRLLQRTGCRLLLDTGHARVAAAALGLAETDYLQALPLDTVQQVHVSGPRLRDGRLFDAHQPLQEEDYALLEWVLARTRPQVVTLEYIREKEALAEQIDRLGRMVSGNWEIRQLGN